MVHSEPLKPQFEVSGAKNTLYIVIIMYPGAYFLKNCPVGAEDCVGGEGGGGVFERGGSTKN